MIIRSRYKIVRAEGEGQTVISTPSLAKQEFREECDINRIMARYTSRGVVPPVVSGGRYGDFSGVTDFLSAQLAVKEAENAFAALPSTVRDRFSNSPAKLMAFLEDPANKDESIKLGLRNASPVEEPKKEGDSK